MDSVSFVPINNNKSIKSISVDGSNNKRMFFHNNNSAYDNNNNKTISNIGTQHYELIGKKTTMKKSKYSPFKSRNGSSASHHHH